ncbi:MAG: hypothetical protein ACRDJJ_05240 [Actinomycetota bacterium]
MVETITPAVHGGSRRRYRMSAALHALGATGSAAALGTVLGGVGALLGAPWGYGGAIAVAVVAAAYALRELLGVPIPIPDRRRQVPDWWRTFFSPHTSALLYGLGLGVGFLTFLSFGTFVVVALAALASGNPFVGLTLCAPFGAARAVAVILARKAIDAEQAARIVDDLQRAGRSRGPGVVNGVALAAIAVAAAL